jgi:two-component system chemotaxis response regulator CheB
MDNKLFVVAIGSSSGGVDALLELAAAMPPRFPTIVLVTQHIGDHPSILPELMRARGPNHAMHAHDGDKPLPGTIYVAPPDHHMLLDRDRIRLFRGPRENYCRPAIDPMFRSVALSWRSRAIGVVLTGQLDDGTAGLKAIKQCGGWAIVQDPATAQQPSMPASALANVEVDFRLRIDEIVPAILRIVGGGEPPQARAAPPESLHREQMIHHGRQTMENLSAIGQPSGLTCPDCGGSLWELKDQKPLRYRCHTGHAFSAQSLQYAQGESAEHALWSSVRSLQEREMLLRRMAFVARAQGDAAQEQAAQEQAERTNEQAQRLVRMIEEENGSA